MQQLTIALIADSLTENALSLEAKILNITPTNYKSMIRNHKIDFLFIESAWMGYKNSWKYKIASYAPKYHFKFKPINYILNTLFPRNNNVLIKIIKYFQHKNIPTIFWNKEDGIHFERFINSAKHCDYIFTVDENCIEKYKKFTKNKKYIGTLPFAIQPKFHNFTGFNFKFPQANFIGSYSKHIHNKRRIWQNSMFEIADRISGLAIFDRNSNRTSDNYRFPTNLKNTKIFPAISNQETAQIYKDYLISLNVNTIEDSPTMFSRRLIEIIACGGIAITNNTPAVEKYFKDYCFTVDNPAEIEEIILKLHKYGPTKEDLQRIKKGALYIAKHHTWQIRLKHIWQIIKTYE